MIFVDRNKINPPNILTSNGKGIKEANLATKFYSKDGNKTKSFPYEVYKDPSIKLAFNSLFHKKCAYCESNYARVHPVDVEHYRPKGGVFVNGHLQKPGYYWLGSNWGNLLPSCIDCNRRRTQEIDSNETELLGKANLFPIINESNRAIQPGYEYYEKRLLLHPCIDKPDEHLKFNEDGTVEGLSFMGIVSIDTYGLRRKDLVDAREQVAKEIKQKIDLIKWFLVQIDKLNEKDIELVNDWEDKIKSEFQFLINYMDSKREYSALARQIIKPFLNQYIDKNATN
ncbi:hypothetical protein CSE16_13855 [Solibacillus sp. R5-41]|uniref:hypothetical protein n=1 Tax=Solibacillus sp. R5-41 TaxID=2048654 RepID=UPI000C1283F0|nr:hypothetical protein [Solibacillus sp. R5-41]ATP41047.1 hypothetical protein CSE16_13855 [Solibacillus sp. R5-41]